MDSQTIIILGGIAVLGLIALGVIHNQLTVKAKKGDVEVSIECSSPPAPPTAPQKSPPSIDKQTNIGGDQLNAAHDIFQFRDLNIGGAKLPALNLNQIGEPVGDFIGREDEIGHLMTAFDARGDKRGAVISGVRGMAGVGKTELAKMAAKRLKKQFPDGQIFFNLRGAHDDDAVQPATPAEALQHVIQSFRPDLKLPDTVDPLQGYYHSVLDGKRVLLLMDNALNGHQLAPLIPPPDGCVLLVTSRRRFVVPGMAEVDLDTLPPPKACELLLEICPRIKGQAADLAERCGRLPLALRLAASALKLRPMLDVADYCNQLEQNRLAALDAYKDGTDQEHGVEASLATSYKLLDEPQQRLWRALEVFPGEFDTPAAANVWQLEEKDGAAALGDLYTASMVQWDEATRRYRLHDLARDYARARLSANERAEYAQRHAAHYAAQLRKAKELYKQGGESVLQGLGMFDLEWGNIRAGQAWAAAHWEADKAAAELCSDYPGAGTYCLDLRLHPREQIAWLEAALDAARKLKDRGVEGVHLGNLGLAYADLGEPRKAIDYHEQALKVDREIGERRGEGQALGNLGNTYADLGEPRKAIEFYEQDLVIAREIGNRRGEGAVLGNLGNAYADLGEPRKAIEFYEQALVIDREIGDRRGEGNALNTLGIAYKNLGKPRKAIEYHKQALEIDREIGDRRGEGNALGNLGNAYAALGEPRKAIEFYEQSLVIAREIGDRRGEATGLYNLADELAKTGRRDEAIASAEQAVEIFEQIESPLAADARALLEELRKQPRGK